MLLLAAPRLVRVILRPDEEGLRVNPRITAILESTPTSAGWQLAVHLVKDGESKEIVFTNRYLPFHEPLVAQNTIILIATGDIDDGCLLLNHRGHSFEAPFGLGSVKGLIDWMIDDSNDKDFDPKEDEPGLVETSNTALFN